MLKASEESTAVKGGGKGRDGDPLRKIQSCKKIGEVKNRGVRVRSKGLRIIC